MKTCSQNKVFAKCEIAVYRSILVQNRCTGILEKREEMGNRIKHFLKLRKQNDTVKIICIFVLAGILCAISVVYHVWGIYHYVNTPAEYILTGDGVVSKKRVDELLKNEGVAKVSRQMDVPVTVMYRGAKAEINCTMLSEEYVKELFDVAPLPDTKTIYMNEAALSELQQALWENNQSTPDMVIPELTEGGAEFDIRYSMEGDPADSDGEGTVVAPQYKAAKLMVVKSKEKESFFCIAEVDNRLLKEAVSIRIQYEQHDLDGLQVEALRKLGYSIDNENVLIEEEYKIQIKLLHTKYGLLCFAICMIGAGMLWRLERRVLNDR